MNVDRERNYYIYGGFGYLVRNYRNRDIRNIIREGRRLEYGQGNNKQNNLNENGDLIVLD